MSTKKIFKYLTIALCVLLFAVSIPSCNQNNKSSPVANNTPTPSPTETPTSTPSPCPTVSATAAPTPDETKTPATPNPTETPTPTPTSTNCPEDSDNKHSEGGDNKPRRSIDLATLIGYAATSPEQYKGFIVDFRDDKVADVQNIIQNYRQKFGIGEPIVIDKDKNKYLINVNPALLAEFRSTNNTYLNNYFEYIEPNYIFKQTSLDRNKLNALYSRQIKEERYKNEWYMFQVFAQEAWDLGYRGQNITVAVIDSGFPFWEDFDNEQFVPGIDYVAKYVAKDEQYNQYENGKPIDKLIKDLREASDENIHGVNIASTIGAARNGVGFIGAAPEVKLMSVRVLDGDGVGEAAYIAKGIKFAVKRNVDVINLSLESDNDSSEVREAIKDAISKGVIVVAAAGNSGQSKLAYPAKYENVISVGSVDIEGEKSPFSNYTDKITIFAPGGGLSAVDAKNAITNKLTSSANCQKDLPEINLDKQFEASIPFIFPQPIGPKKSKKARTELGTCSGTSQAAAVTSGAVALVKQVLKSERENGPSLVAEVAKIIRESATRRQWRKNDNYLRLNVGAAVRYALAKTNSQSSDVFALAEKLKEVSAKIYIHNIYNYKYYEYRF